MLIKRNISEALLVNKVDTQYCVKILSHPLFLCILLQRSQIFLEFLKYS